MNAATEFLSDVTSQGALPDTKVWVGRAKGDREYYQNGFVNLRNKTSPAVVAHEVAHHIELAHPHVQERVAEFAAKRFGDEKPTSMQEVCPGFGYGNEESGRKDDLGKLFDDPRDAYYVGKVYPGSPATEVVSVGVELLYRDPKRFAETDPEYFGLIVGILQEGKHERGTGNRTGFGEGLGQVNGSRLGDSTPGPGGKLQRDLSTRGHGDGRPVRAGLPASGGGVRGDGGSTAGRDGAAGGGHPVSGVPDQRQDTAWTCGPTALQAALQGLGIILPEADLAKQLGATPEGGTTPEAILRVAQSLGLQAEGKQLQDYEKLAIALDTNDKGRGIQTLILCPIQRHGTEAGDSAAQNGHWVVVRDYRPDRDYRGILVMQDPARGPEGGTQEMLAEEFLRCWHDMDADGQRYVRYAIYLSKA